MCFGLVPELINESTSLKGPSLSNIRVNWHIGSALFDMEIEDPVLGRKLSHSYIVQALPIVS